jgi:hypothetical protein
MFEPEPNQERHANEVNLRQLYPDRTKRKATLGVVLAVRSPLPPVPESVDGWNPKTTSHRLHSPK